MTRILTALFFITLTLWLGISIARLIVGYDAFVAGTTTLKDWYAPEIRIHNLWLYTLLAGWTGWSFAIAFVAGTTSMLLQRKQWKQHAWMLMILIFLCLLLPAQGWLIKNDIELWNLFNPNTSTAVQSIETVTNIFVQRMTGAVFSVVNGLVILTGLTIVVTLATRPLTQSK